ncbi:T9SS type A sorting domain-containing protein [Flavobacterium sp. UBA6135]|uniref:T9SS type A sorting domain-containing protein n=1 Tax=Flavobacterium sp. UBA6135 TaxID=1946553 RepID=UPI0025C43D38|nr:T9SS type A sorting domain-containing protein [Flavobacterium sp. UBA6135]
MKKITLFISLFTFGLGFAQNLITNGDFENGTTGWSGNQATAPNIVTVSGNSYFSHNVVAAGNPWDANLSYVLNIPASGVNYTLTFTAWSNTNRVLTAGIGLNQDPWTNVNQNVNLTSVPQTFVLNFTSNFASPTSRIIFDMGQATGFVNIDNVILELAPSTPTQLDLLLGFESSESGGINGAPFGNGPEPTIEAGTGTNTSQVLKIVGNPSGEPWQGINLNLTSLVNLTESKTMTMDVFSDSPITFLVKVTGGVGGPGIVAASASHPGGSTWQTISVTFDTALDGQAAPANGTYNGFVIHTYWAPGAVGFFNPTVPTPARTFYVDNIRGPLGTPPVEPAPTTAAPTPPARPAADVKSIFSDAYAPISEIGYTGEDNTYNNSWCGANTTLVQIQGNNTHKVTGLGCEGITFLAGRFDATTFTHFHMDIWTDTPTLDKSFNVKFSNWNGGAGEANAIEFSVTNANFLTNPNPGTWISLDIPLTNFAPIINANRNDIVQFVITSDLGIVYYDNLYLHKNTTLGVTSFETSKIKMYPNPATTNFTIDAQEVVEKLAVYNLLGQEVISLTPNSQQVAVDISRLQVGVYVVKATINGSVSTSRIVKE